MTDQVKFMRECEARYFLAMPRAERDALMVKVLKHRGPEATEDLKKRVNAEYIRQREQQHDSNTSR